MTESGKYQHIVPAYHGTSSVRAEKILAEGFDVTRGENGWFGAGAYFWENDEELTKTHCRLAMKDDGSEYGSTIRVQVDLSDAATHWLDLTNARSRKQYVKRCIDAFRSNRSIGDNLSRIVNAGGFDQFFTELLRDEMGESLRGVRVITALGNSSYSHSESYVRVNRLKTNLHVAGAARPLYSLVLVDVAVQLIVFDVTAISEWKVIREKLR